MSDWKDYLIHAGKRLGKTVHDTDVSRTEFQRDYDRIIFFDAFRRLQNKTQVLPVPKSDEVRNRLTHSLETASVGRSLGFLAGKFILQKYPSLQQDLHLRPDDFGYMVSAAALAHDIGNPPFGHEGETAVREFFKSSAGNRFLENLTEKQKQDFYQFEGNAAGLRILAHTTGNNQHIKGGLRLSLGTLGAFVKYPKEAYPDRQKEKKASLKKFGVFQSELDMFETLAEDLALIPQHLPEGKAWKRFPLAFLTEAADDICYTIIDYEDGYHLGFIEESKIRKRFYDLAALNDEQTRIYRKIRDPKQKIAYLRAHAIGRLIKETVNVFNNHEEEIRNGTFDKPLTKELPAEIRNITEKILSESRAKIYNHPAVLKNEAGGKTVIPFLLEKFLSAQFEPGKHKQYEQLIPEKYRRSQTPYEKIMDTVMFVTSMSDRQAVEWYRNFNGIQLAEY